MPSSCTISLATMRKPRPARTSTTAGPERSARSPRAQESLTVTTAAVNGVAFGAGKPGSVIEEDIFFLFLALASACAGTGGASRTARARRGSCARGTDAGVCTRNLFRSFPGSVTLSFIQQAQTLHQQALCIELSGLFICCAIEVELKISAGPAQNPEHCRIPNQIAGRRQVGRVLHLPLNKENFALVALMIQLELAALAAHLERLHQVNHIHLREAA